MKALLLIPIVIVLGACSTPKIAGFKEPEVLTRVEVTQASKDCINAKMKPVIQHLPQKTEHGTIMIPVFVNCEVYSR